MWVHGHPAILLFLIKFHSSIWSSSSQNVTRPRSPGLMNEEDDYSIYEDSTTKGPSFSSSTTEAPELNPCDYDLCVEQKQSCQELASLFGCLCPGLTGPFIPPSAPRLLFLTPQDRRGVVVHWCAPTSTVTHYTVRVKDIDEAHNRKIEVETRKRAAVLEDVAAGVLVCVDAVNKAGVSKEDEQSCMKFELQDSESGLALKLGIIGGVVGVILLLVLVLLLWRIRTRRKAGARTEREGVL
ncbi:hypothetical protein DNTS_024957 [Danionella cerebrum]|uniref:Fibronectin type-III domain-containing protein n=1 Tax=Danionella cerebrum TaxID=2873325 RepID=A0A553MW15_9TELE|nr:hypothetical protein DNTS_024957 [Danionella translucida]